MTARRELLRVADIALQLGVSRCRVYQLIAEGVLPSMRVGGAIRIPRIAWLKWLARCNAHAFSRIQSVGDRAGWSGHSHGARTSKTDRVVVDALRAMSECEPGGWRGTATDLLERLRRLENDPIRGAQRVPGDGRALSVVLRRIAPWLDSEGIGVTFSRRGHGGKRVVEVWWRSRNGAEPDRGALIDGLPKYVVLEDPGQ